MLGPEDAPIAGYFWAVKASGNVDPSTDIQGELKGKVCAIATYSFTWSELIVTHPQNTLYQAHPYEVVADKFGVSVDQVKSVIARAIPKLRAQRDKTRPRPHLDDKILTGWNGLMVSGERLGTCLVTHRSM